MKHVVDPHFCVAVVRTLRDRFVSVSLALGLSTSPPSSLSLSLALVVALFLARAICLSLSLTIDLRMGIVKWWIWEGWGRGRKGTGNYFKAVIDLPARPCSFLYERMLARVCMCMLNYG